MALIQRYSTELTTRAGSSRYTHDEHQAVEHVLNDIAGIKRQDEDDQRYLHSLNDRLEDLLRHLDGLEQANKGLRDDLSALISGWGIGGENRARFLQELDVIIRRLSEENRRRILFQAEAKLFDEQTQLTDRVSVVFVDVMNLYRDKCQILADLTNELEEELRKIRLRLDISHRQVKSHDDDYRHELAKFRSYLAEWSQLALEKQHLLNEIQSLKERYNLRLAYNQEEINEWQRLLNRISQESKNFYRDYLDTIKQQIQMDYEQMAKDQQLDIEVKLKGRLKEIEDRVQQGLPMNEQEERRRREESQRFESRLDENTKDYERLQQEYRALAEGMQHKRRTLQDLDNEMRNKLRKEAEQRARLERETDMTRAEYYALKDELDKLAYTLRFSVEEELKIYEALLNSVHRKRDERPTPMIDNFSSGGESTGFHRSQPNLSETTRILTTHTTTEDSSSFRAPPPRPLLTEISRTFVTTKPEVTKITKQQTDNAIPVIRVDPPSNHWTYETVSSGSTSSTHGDSTDRDRSAERTIIPTRMEPDRYGIQQNMFDQNRTTTTTTRTTRRFDQEGDDGQQRTTSGSRQDQVATPEIDEKFLQSKIHITRKYKGNILIKFVDVGGRFVEVENTGNQVRDLTGWYIERDVDGRRFEFTFPVYELDAHQTVRIYGNYHRRSSATDADRQLQLIAPNFYDWGNGRQMRTELFNRDDVGKALFEQTIRD